MPSMRNHRSYSSYRGPSRGGGLPLLPILAAAAMVFLAVAAVRGIGPFSAFHAADAEHSVPPSQDTESPDTQADADVSSLPAAETPVPAETPEPTPEPLPEDGRYVFGEFLEETEPVPDDSVFDGAVFLGDSRTEGLQVFSGLKHGTFRWDRGMNVFRAVSEDYQVFEVDGEPANLVECLAERQYDAVYLMLGINEMGYAVSAYQSALYNLLDAIREAQPEAVLYLQTMPPVNEEVCRSNGLGDWLTNANVDAFNEVIKQAAKEKQWVLLDTASIYRGEDGSLPAERTSDGVHFTFDGYGIWARFLRCHRIDKDRYLRSRTN